MEPSEESPPNSPSTCRDSLKNKPKIRAKKRKRECSTSSDEDDILPENTLEFENMLHVSAIKNNLDDVSVKKILKKVVTNDHVLALVKLREEEELAHSDKDVQPKLTRSKVKELMKESPDSAPWNLELIPIKHIPVKTRPEVTALIAQELPEDEDDEEYQPTNDDVPSDDDHATCSDIDSQPKTPATPKSASKSSPKVVTDGPFKVPQETVSQAKRKLDLEEDATIALRTRSKLSLSETPIEHIESSFVPPDDIPVPYVDDLWSDFLEGCLNPVCNTRNEEDDETDPEYNVAADPDAVEEDEESLENSLIKISKKELNDLVTELFSVMPDQELTPLLNEAALENGNELSKPQWEGKPEPLSDEEVPQSSSARLTFERHDNIRISIGKMEPVDYQDEAPIPNIPVIEARPQEVSIEETIQEEQGTENVEPPPVVQSALNVLPETLHIKIYNDNVITPQQILILQQQLRMHIQISVSNFLQLFVNPNHWAYAPKYKEYLEILNKMGEENANSVVNVCNLKPAVELVSSWESTVAADTPDNNKMVEFMQAEADRCRRRSLANSVYIGEFPDTFKKVIANSPVFLYPYLLPGMPFRPDLNKKRCYYLPSEEQLIVLGLDQFWTYVENNPEIFAPPPRGNPRHRWGLTATIELLCKYMFPWVTMKTMAGHIASVRKAANKNHPIKRFFANRHVEPTKHKLMPFNPELTLYEQPENEMPRLWVRYLAKSSKRFRSYLHKKRAPNYKPPDGIDIGPGTQLVESPKRPLPIEFVKTLPSNRINLIPIKTSASDRVDVHIPSKEPVLIPNIFKVVNTESGAILVPVEMKPNDADDTKNYIHVIDKKTTTDNTNKGTDKVNQMPSHCSCCVLLRKISKYRQKHITEYIKKYKVKLACPCGSVTHPSISNKLKLLLKNYKGGSKLIFDNLREKIERLKKKKTENKLDFSKMAVSEEADAKDLAFVTMFQIRLSLRQNKARNTQIKRTLFRILSQFNTETGDPIELMNEIYNACEIDLADMYKEFLGFLTAEQAEKIDKFRDYFVHNCMEDLIKKTEETVADKNKKTRIFEYLMRLSKNAPMSCVVCSELLDRMRDYPELARYCFFLFPHRRKVVLDAPRECVNKNTETQVDTCINVDDEPIEVNDSNEDIYTTETQIISSDETVHKNNTHVLGDANNTQTQIDENISTNNIHTNKEAMEVNNICTQMNGDISTNSTSLRIDEDMNVNNTRTQEDDDKSMNNTSSQIDEDNMNDNITRSQDGDISMNNANSDEDVNENRRSTQDGDINVNNTFSRIDEDMHDVNITNTQKDGDNMNNTTSRNNEDMNVNITNTQKDGDISTNNTPSRIDEEMHVSKGDINMNNTHTKRDEDVKMKHTQLENDVIMNTSSQIMNGNADGDEEEEMEHEGMLRICEDSNRSSDGVIITSSDEDPKDVQSNEEKENVCTKQNGNMQFIAPVKSENGELTVTKSEILDDIDDKDEDDEDPSLFIVPDEDPSKMEPSEWKRDEDKLILEVLKQHLTPEERKDKTIFEIIEEKNIPQHISDSLAHKSLNDVRDRIFYLLQILVMNDLN